MKKLNLQLGSIKEMLTKEQMKKVAGGYDDGQPCPDGTYDMVTLKCCFADDDPLHPGLCSNCVTICGSAFVDCGTGKYPLYC